MKRRLILVMAALLAVLVFAGSSGAETLGITAAPVGANAGVCQGSGLSLIQSADSSGTRYTVPAGGGLITQWQVLTAGDTPGASLSLFVLAPNGTGDYAVVASDGETIPDPLPSAGVASFTLAHPIQAAAGDTFALVGSSTTLCYYYGGAISTEAAVTLSDDTTGTGSTLTDTTGTELQHELALAVTLVTTQDSAVTTSTLGSPAVGSPFMFASTVTNNGPELTPITFTDQVPTGLQILAAAAGSGSCSVDGQTVTCTITGLGAGQSAPVVVVVTASEPGSYANSVSVAGASGITDENSANNTASVSAVVPAVPPSTSASAQKCIVPTLKRVMSASARAILGELGCTVKIKTERSSLAKGLVISVEGGVATYPYHQLVMLVVSSGRKPKKKRKKH
jgi:hypothetical protein